MAEVDNDVESTLRNPTKTLHWNNCQQSRHLIEDMYNVLAHVGRV